MILISSGILATLIAWMFFSLARNNERSAIGFAALGFATFLISAVIFGMLVSNLMRLSWVIERFHPGPDGFRIISFVGGFFAARFLYSSLKSKWSKEERIDIDEETIDGGLIDQNSQQPDNNSNAHPY